MVPDLEVDFEVDFEVGTKPDRMASNPDLMGLSLDCMTSTADLIGLSPDLVGRLSRYMTSVPDLMIVVADLLGRIADCMTLATVLRPGLVIMVSHRHPASSPSFPELTVLLVIDQWL
jgi:hypothetical protein